MCAVLSSNTWAAYQIKEMARKRRELLGGVGMKKKASIGKQKPGGYAIENANWIVASNN